MVTKIKRGDSYCVLPFNHMNMHPNGNISLCCVAKMFPPDDGFYRHDDQTMANLNNDTLRQIWEFSSVNKIRHQMLTGELPNACLGCKAIEDNGGVSRRLTENKRWGEQRDSAGLQFLDLRLSNKCNLQCMMCFPDSSSSLIPSYKKWVEKLDYIPNNTIEPESFQWFNSEIIEQIMDYKRSLRYLYINGGEPFIMESHWKFLERLIEEGVAKNIRISYNTNCTVYAEKYSDYWKHFKDVTLGLSVDAIGDKNTFIRYPSNWEKLNDNVLKFIHNETLSHVNITCSIQWLNAPFLHEFYDWALPIVKQKYMATINQNFIVFPYYLSLNCTSNEFKNKLHNRLKESEHNNEILTPTMLSYLNPVNEEASEAWDQGIKFCDTVAETRKMGNWRDIFKYEYKY